MTSASNIDDFGNTEDRIRSIRESLASVGSVDFDRDCLRDSESPIEALWMASMLRAGWRRMAVVESLELTRFLGLHAHFEQPSLTVYRDGHNRSLCAARQPSLKVESGRTYRLDMLLWEVRSRVAVALELDGHPFHERTKEQAVRDRARDRDLLVAGLPVMRFTGSEVFAGCAGLIEDLESSIFLIGFQRADQMSKSLAAEWGEATFR